MDGSADEPFPLPERRPPDGVPAPAFGASEIAFVIDLIRTYGPMVRELIKAIREARGK